ncbi:type II toxin-antitoxin system RelB/DinJ family antitoxin [Lactobacillus gallinarum]|uniref:type II toxin-antitoxin system RelB/DinJ family antitoxin n=1 Tax=Lactobacillus gallinarum TaxID=52242 RepID=UPI00259AEF00|nr:type II toxin-antitoxin system RelB/DinJ family antitoxin [Lactobacillus gallinarum]
MASYKKIQANVDSNLALQAEGIFKDIGLNTTTAINVFLKKVVATGGIPFELKETPEQKATRDLVQTISKLPQRKISRIG